MQMWLNASYKRQHVWWMQQSLTIILNRDFWFGLKFTALSKCWFLILFSKWKCYCTTENVAVFNCNLLIDLTVVAKVDGLRTCGMLLNTLSNFYRWIVESIQTGCIQLCLVPQTPRNKGGCRKWWMLPARSIMDNDLPIIEWIHRKCCHIKSALLIKDPHPRPCFHPSPTIGKKVWEPWQVSSSPSSSHNYQLHEAHCTILITILPQQMICYGQFLLHCVLQFLLFFLSGYLVVLIINLLYYSLLCTYGVALMGLESCSK